MSADPEHQASALKPSVSPTVSDESIFVWIVVLWLATLLYFDPRLLALITGSPSPIAKAAIIIFVICLNLFWFYTLYYVIMIAMSWRLRRRAPEPELPSLSSHPAVALLYPTRNDFREEAVETLLKIDYPNFHLFILDDSNLDEFKESIDRWASAHVAKVTVVRRDNLQGFKAGNINHGLSQIHKNYPYFAVCDSDGIFPSNFIKGLLPYFEADPRVAFVQARQDGNPDQPGFFGQAMGYAVAMHFRHYVRARQDYGFVMFYGHGALMKTAVWEEVGGFPEIVTEDLAYSAKIRTLGYRGVYTEQVICCEDYPPTFAQLRKRTEKWIRGTAEFLRLGYGEFYRSEKVPWFEKVDVLIHSTTHFMAVPMLVFLLTLGTILPAYYSHFRYPGSFFLMPVPAETKAPFDYLIHVRYHIFWSVD
ncbi:MAG: glycosyltransferase, partial [Acidobacteria bacterium]|nr:glycosyltransferase [Acidobacteriota bacterium]